MGKQVLEKCLRIKQQSDRNNADFIIETPALISLHQVQPWEDDRQIEPP